MLNPQPLDRDYLIDSLDDVQDLIDGLSFNVHDHQWLIYCALGGHEQGMLPTQPPTGAGDDAHTAVDGAEAHGEDSGV